MSVVSFFTLASFILSYFLITSKLAYFSYKYSKHPQNYFILAVVAFVIFFLICRQVNSCDQVYQIFVLLYIFSFWFFFRNNRFKLSLSNIIFYILFFSVISTYALHQNNDRKEREFRKMIAVKLSSEQRDPLAEYLFSEIYDSAQNDIILNRYLEDYLDGNVEEDAQIWLAIFTIGIVYFSYRLC